MGSKYERFWAEMSRSEDMGRNDEKINRHLRFLAVRENLAGVRKILDVGAGTGAFSIPLARLGYEVVHLDISDEMLEIAKNRAVDIPNITFMKKDAADLDAFSENEFDLVLCFDGAISFSGKKAKNVISEICRVGRKVMVSVSSKSCMVATWLNYSLSKQGRVHPAVIDMMKTGYFNKMDYHDADNLTAIQELQTYDAGGLRDILERFGMRVLECRSIGSLTHLYLLHLYRQYPYKIVHEKINALGDDEYFLAACDYFDKYVMPEGMGSFERAGIFAVAEKGNKK